MVLWFVAVDPSGLHQPHWADFGEGIDPFGLVAFLVEGGRLDLVEIDSFGLVAFPDLVGIAPFGLVACLVEAGIVVAGCSVVAARPWRFVATPLEEVLRLGLAVCLFVDELLRLRQHQSFGRL